jgi:hypothetical protein
VNSPQSEDQTASYFGDEADFTAIHVAKRRRSEDSTVSNLTSQLSSMSRRFKDRKRISGISLFTRNSNRSRAPSASRSSSVATSVRSGYDHVDVPMPITPIQPPPETPIEPVEDDIVCQEVEVDPPDREVLASTPLLPPLLKNVQHLVDTPSQSPLQSPTVADGHFSFSNTPAGTPRIRAQPTPPLSTKPSYSSLSASRSGFPMPPIDVPPFKLSESDDRWANKLGHANFTISPEPYLPDDCNAATCQRHFADWEQARCNFMVHQVRTGEHHGVTSKAYKLTDQKWAEIDAQWKEYHEAALAKAGLDKNEVHLCSPIEPAPLVKLPSLNNKFPAKGDEDIVGPMVQAMLPVSPRQSRKASFLRFFSDLKSPSSFFKRH